MFLNNRYHRGNISTMIRQLGYGRTTTEFIFFLRMKG
ncbi:DinB family protein [Neobacillus novalis]